MMREAAVALLLLAACAPEPVREPAGDDVREEILRQVASYYTAFSDRDWNAFADHFWPGATMTTVWQAPGESGPRVVATTVPRFIEQAPLGPDSKPIFEERMDRAEVRSQGNLAHVWAHYTARFGDSNDVATWHGIDAFTFMKHDGRWKIVALAYTDAP
jgi:Domain of unknown function (DUF4440)